MTNMENKDQQANQEPADNQEQPIEQEQDTKAAELELENADKEDPTESALEKQLQECNDKYLRLVAEFDNFRKRTAREKAEIITNASESLIISLLEVLDDSDRALQEMDKSATEEPIKEGIHLVFKKFRNLLEKKGLTEIEAIHADFDTDYHEALTEIPAPTPELVGKVVDQVGKGYKLNDKVIRHAKVVVGK